MKNLGSMAIVACLLLCFSGCQWFGGSCGCGSCKKSAGKQCSCGQSSCSCDKKGQCCGEKNCQCDKQSMTKNCACASCGGGEKTALASSGIKDIVGNEEFDKYVVKSDKPVVVDFGAKWCGVCKIMAPIFDDIAKKLGSKYTFVSVDVDKSPELAKEYNIRGVPAFLFFKGGKNVGERIGKMSQTEFEKAIEDNLKD